MESEGQKSELEIVPGKLPRYEPHIRWRKGYRLTELGTPGRVYPLPGREVYLNKEDILSSQNTLVFHERSGGGQDFLDWWCNHLDDAEQAWVMIQGSDWSQEFFKWSAKAKAIQRQAKNEDINPARAIEAFGQENGAPKRLNALKNWGDNLQEPFTLIIRDLMNLDKENALEVATAFRMIRDGNSCPNLKVVIASKSESIFMDYQDRSGFRILCSLFRLPMFKHEEVEVLVEWSPKNEKEWPLGTKWLSLKFERKAKQRFLEHTGGQPLLVQRLLNHIQDLKLTEDPVKKVTTCDEVDRAARQMKASPPEATRSWQDELRRLLATDQERIRSMQAYSVGKSLGPARFPPPPFERALFIAGWVKQDPITERWGISSLMHAHLARPVLDEFLGGENDKVR